MWYKVEQHKFYIQKIIIKEAQNSYSWWILHSSHWHGNYFDDHNHTWNGCCRLGSTILIFSYELFCNQLLVMMIHAYIQTCLWRNTAFITVTIAFIAVYGLLHPSHLKHIFVGNLKAACTAFQCRL